MTRKLWLGAALSALVIAALAPWSASKANGVSIGISTPEFGIRIGAPHRPAYYPAPVYVPPPVVYRPAPRYIAPPIVYGYPYYRVGGHWGHYRHGHGHHHWRHHGHHGSHHGHHRGHDRHRGHGGHWR